jgi:hypothetical protein
MVKKIIILCLTIAMTITIVVLWSLNSNYAKKSSAFNSDIERLQDEAEELSNKVSLINVDLRKTKTDLLKSKSDYEKLKIKNSFRNERMAHSWKFEEMKTIISSSLEGRELWVDPSRAERFRDIPIKLPTIQKKSCKNDVDEKLVEQLSLALMYYERINKYDPDKMLEGLDRKNFLTSDEYFIIRTILSNERLNFDILINEALKYKRKIESIDNWQEIFDTTNERGRYNTRWFYEQGFPETDVPCINDYYYFSGGVVPEQWLYSFWLRRYQAGTYERTEFFLELLRKSISHAS